MTAARLVCTASVAVAMAVATGCSGDGGGPIVSGPGVSFATVPPAESTGITLGTDVTGTSTVESAPPVSSPDPASTAIPPGATLPGTDATAAPPVVPTAPPTTQPLGDPVIGLSPVASFDAPVDLAWRAGDPTMYVVEQDGVIVPLRDGRAGDPALDITNLTEGEGERGLLGLTFSPDGATAYINHTDNSGDTVIASYAVGANGVFDARSRIEMLTIDQPYGNHNGGNVTIGPDGMLYIGMGDGGSAGDPQRRALNVSNPLGKILRIDPTPSADAPYTVPADNPFVDVEGAVPEIWSVGVRNPWRMSFDPATGDLWFGDVGQGEIEEIDVAWASDGAGRGVNFGWSAFEGTNRYNDDQSPDGATPPIYEYEHGAAGCSVSGGAVYRGTSVPALVGWFVFGDYCSGNLYALRMDGRSLADTSVLGNTPSVSAVRAGPDGELYVLSLAGRVSRIVAA